MREVQLDWYSPTRLDTSPNTQYYFPGDRFIPNRSLMDLNQAQSLLTNRNVPNRNPNFSEAYRQMLQDQVTLDSDGNPFRMLVFRGSPKSNRKSIRCVDEMRRSDEYDYNKVKLSQPRTLPKRASRILDARNIEDDFYTNIMDWGKNNSLAVALGRDLYVWNLGSGNVHRLHHVHENDYPTSVAWSQDAKFLAVGYNSSKLQLWDPEAFKLVRCLEGHNLRVATVAWRCRTLTSGSQDECIINHDVRARNNVTCRVKAHCSEVCGLKWSETGNFLASGSADNILYIWESSKMNSSKFLHRFEDHCAAVKALAWCPYKSTVLASGGGTEDGSIKLWDTQDGTCVNTIDTNSQVCGLEWNRHHKEILSAHGYCPLGTEGIRNQLCLWKYPSMDKVGDWKCRERVLHLRQSPDGLSVAAAVADESIGFWDIFGPPSADKLGLSALDSFLHLKTSPIR